MIDWIVRRPLRMTPRILFATGLSQDPVDQAIKEVPPDNTEDKSRSLDAFSTLDVMIRGERELPSGQNVVLSLFGPRTKRNC